MKGKEAMYNIQNNQITFAKITNGSKIIIGDTANKLTIVVDHHFNWFQKKMIKWCFGFNVENYTEQTEELI